MNDIIQLAFASLFILLITQSLTLAIITTFLMCIFISYAFINNKLPNLSLFGWIKGISVFIPIILYTCYPYLNQSINIPTLFFTIVLALNILEPPLLIQLYCKEPLSIINGILTIILALYTPILSFDKKIGFITFNNHWLWTLSNTAVLGSFYLFNDKYNTTPSVQKWLLFAIAFPTIFSILMKSTNLWLPLRVYSLALVLFMYSNPSLNKIMTNKNDRYLTDFTKDRYNWLRLVSVITNIGLVAAMVKHGNKNTFIDYLLN